MKNDDNIPERSQVDYPERSGLLAYPDLPYTLTYRLERFSFRRVMAFLDLAELESCLGSRIVWKVPETA